MSILIHTDIYRKVHGIKNVAKGLAGSPTFRILLQCLGKLKDSCSKCLTLRGESVE